MIRSRMIVISTHARQRLLEREIPVEWAEAAVLAPDWMAPDDQPGVMRSYRAMAEKGGRVLRVVHRAHGHDIILITAFFDRNAQRPT